MSSSTTSRNLLYAGVGSTVIAVSSLSLALALPSLNDWRKARVSSTLTTLPQQPQGLQGVTLKLLELSAPRDPRVELAAARLARERGEADAALAILERVRGESPEADRERARGYLELGRIAEGYRAAALAYAQRPGRENERLLVLSAALGGEGSTDPGAAPFLNSPEAAGRIKTLKLSKVAQAQEAYVLGLYTTSGRVLGAVGDQGTLGKLLEALLADAAGGDKTAAESALTAALRADPANTRIRALLAELSSEEERSRHEKLLRELEAGKP